MSWCSCWYCRICSCSTHTRPHCYWRPWHRSGKETWRRSGRASWQIRLNLWLINTRPDELWVMFWGNGVWSNLRGLTSWYWPQWCSLNLKVIKKYEFNLQIRIKYDKIDKICTLALISFQVVCKCVVRLDLHIFLLKYIGPKPLRYRTACQDSLSANSLLLSSWFHEMLNGNKNRWSLLAGSPT